MATFTTAGVVHVLAEVAASHTALVDMVIGSQFCELSATLTLCDAGADVPVFHVNVPAADDPHVKNSIYRGAGGGVVFGTTAVTMFENPDSPSELIALTL